MILAKSRNMIFKSCFKKLDKISLYPLLWYYRRLFHSAYPIVYQLVCRNFSFFPPYVIQLLLISVSFLMWSIKSTVEYERYGDQVGGSNLKLGKHFNPIYSVHFLTNTYTLVISAPELQKYQISNTRIK